LRSKILFIKNRAISLKKLGNFFDCNMPPKPPSARERRIKTYYTVQEELMLRYGPKKPFVAIGVQLRKKYFDRLKKVQHETQMYLSDLVTFIIAEYLDVIAPKLVRELEKLKKKPRKEKKEKKSGKGSGDSPGRAYSAIYSTGFAIHQPDDNNPHPVLEL
jgi:hypothetical protein